MSQSDALKQRESTDEKPAGQNTTLVIGLAAAVCVILVASLVRSITSGGPDAPLVDVEQTGPAIDTRAQAPLQSFLSEALTAQQTTEQRQEAAQPTTGLIPSFVPPVRERTQDENDLIQMALQSDINGNVVIEELEGFGASADLMPAQRTGMTSAPNPEVSSRAADLQATIARLEELNRRAAAPNYDEVAALNDLNNLSGAGVNTPASPSGAPSPTARLLAPGILIQSVLSNEINSDVPANFTALVKYPVYDSSRQFILIPTGSRIYGRVGTTRMTNEIIQQRLTLQVQGIVLPDDRIINIDSAALDAAGAGGVSGRTESHFWARTLGTFGYAVLGVSPSLTITNGDPQSSTDEATGEFLQQFSTNFTPLANQYASLVPTRIIPVGTAINVVIETPVYVEPYAPVRQPLDFGGAL